MLAERLRELQAAGIVEPGPPESVTYALAEEAGQLLEALRTLRAWAATKSVSRERSTALCGGPLTRRCASPLSFLTAV
ncbi:MAG: winged helix-turn-helix transcriptional regulator [Acidimicrobiia bacterium]